MSVDTYVFVRDDRLPTIAQWQTALNQAATNIELQDVGDLRVHTGYLPARHQGRESGFEWYYGSIDENYGGPPLDGLGDRGHVINFVTHSDMRELAVAMISSAILAQAADGLVFDEESGELIRGEPALPKARGVESLIED